MWRHSVFHDTFSISLPKAEEAAFEEKFKYLIVTSPLLSEALMFHHSKQKHRFSGQLPFQAPRAPKLGIASNLITSLVLLFGAERYAFRHRLPLFTLTCSTTASLFFFYRYRRLSSIRQLYHTVLSKVQSFIEQCDAFDTKIHRILITIQEIELVSRGYRLSTPLSPISRIEQNSKKRKCVHLRNRLASVLRRAFIVHEQGIIDLVDVIDKQHLLGLYEMYNVDSMASLSGVESSDDDDTFSLDQLKQLTQAMHLKRRECMVHFLALGVDIDKNGWKVVNDILSQFLKEFEAFTNEMVEALDAEFYKPINEFDSKTNKFQDSRLKLFVHRLSSLEQELRTIEAKIYLCNEGVRQLNSESTQETKEKLMSDYMTVQKGFENMLLEWENGKEALQSYLELPSEIATREKVVAAAPAVEEQDIQEETEGKGIILDSEDVADILNLPSKASVYEAIAGVVEKNGKERPKKSRNERIEEMKVRRAQEAEQRAKRMDSETMVHELKSVLDKRNTDLELQE
ncbi:hypothetical protein G6F66_006390 [Rhizopus arrhizus]|nr:hypothetical protein G6F66_006390 [Rhizopus arrhizus]